MSMEQAMRSVRPAVLLTIASSFAMGEALHRSNLDQQIADFLLPIFEQGGRFGVVLGLYLLTAFMSSWVSNAAAVNIMFPIGVSFFHKGGISAHSLTYTYVDLRAMLQC
jgi:di/tricarboxylate transporter